MNSAYFNQITKQKGGDAKQLSATIIISRCGCGFDKFKNKLEKYKIPYIDAYQLLFSTIIDGEYNENTTNLCIDKILTSASRYDYVTIFFALPIRKDVVIKFDRVLHSFITLIAKTYAETCQCVYLNFDPLLLFSILSKELCNPSQIVDIGTVFTMFEDNDLLLTNDYPMDFMFKYSTKSLCSKVASGLPAKIIDRFRELMDKYIYVKMYHNEPYVLQRIMSYPITDEVWNEGFDELYDKVTKI